MTKGLYLYKVRTSYHNELLLMSQIQDIAAVSSVANRLTKNKNSEEYGAVIKSVEYIGQIDN